jgi:hypothetical protein
VLDLKGLNDDVRRRMVSEIEADVAAGTLYMSSRLNVHGHQEYPRLLKEAAKSHDDTWLAAQLATGGVFKGSERGMAWGHPTMSRMDRTAPVTLAEGEFNRYYMRGLCLYAIENGITELEVYRAKDVTTERRESHAIIGNSVDPQVLLNDCRAPVGTRTQTGLPGGPNSGLSVRIPK